MSADYNALLKRFPSIDLPKETVSPREVRDPDSIYLAQPCGKRAYAWFTYCKNKNICFILDIKEKVPCNIYPVHAAFSSALSLGTVLHGTLLQHQGARCFVADNIFYYKGVELNQSYQEKFALMGDMLKHAVDSNVYMPSQVTFHLPVYSYHPQPFDTIYKLYCVKCIQLNGPKIVNFQDRTATWTVVALDKCDTYELFNDAGVSQGLAGVDTYDRSLFLNDLFRNLPETKRLDAVEESDDESTEVLERKIKMFCRWNATNKKWVPLNVA